MAKVHTARKDFDGEPRWDAREDREGVKLLLAVALRLDGELGGGAGINLSTRREAWERDLYGQVTVWVPAIRRHVRLCPVEWRPLRTHGNPGHAPEELRLLTLCDRYHPFEINRDFGIDVLTQKYTGVAAPLPRAIASFSDYIHLCADLWNCPDMRRVPPPPWSKVLL